MCWVEHSVHNHENVRGQQTNVISVFVQGGVSVEVVTEEAESFDSGDGPNGNDGETAEEEVDEEADEDSEEEVVEGSEEEAAEEVSFSDITGHWAEQQILDMASIAVVKENPDGTFDPNVNLNRAASAALLHRIAFDAAKPAEVLEDSFSDVNKGGWYAGYVSEMKTAGLLDGNPDGTFDPGKNINRAEFLTMAMNVYYFLSGNDPGATELTDHFADLDQDAWYAETVSAAYGLGYVNGSSCGDNMCFKADSEITRAEATVILHNMFFE